MSNPQRSASQRKHRPNQPSTSTSTSITTSTSKARKPDPTTPPSRQRHSRHQSAAITANKPSDGTKVSTDDSRLHTSSSKTQAHNPNNAQPHHVHSHSQPNFTPNLDIDIDQDTHLSFSPSKARALAQQTQQFTQLKNWLSSLLPPSPTFSSSLSQSISNNQINDKTKINNADWEACLSKWHNEFSALSQSDPILSQEIQRWMQEVMYLNRAADEKRKLLHAAQVEELQDRKERRHDVNGDFKQEGGGEDREGDEGQRQQQQREEEEAVDININENENDNDNEDEVMITTTNSKIYDTLMNDLLQNLTPEAQTSLTSLATSSINLGYMPTSNFHSTLNSRSNAAQPQPAPPQTTLLSTLSTPLLQLTQTLQTHNQTLASLTHFQNKIQTHQKQLDFHLTKSLNVQTSNKSEGEYLQAQTARFTREMRVIAAKVGEYEDRIRVLGRSRPSVRVDGREVSGGGRNVDTNDLRVVGRKREEVGADGINKFVSREREDGRGGVIGVEDILHLQERVRRRKVVVDGLERRIRAFHGLPPDLEASRMEVKRAQAELDRLKMRREELFSSVGR